MDYYGYFSTFNFLVVEAQLVATLIGFETIFFIFWYKEKYKRMILYGKKELEKKNKFWLAIGTILFIWIIFFGSVFLISCMETLHDAPFEIEILISQGKEIDDILNELNELHTIFVFWTFISSIYIVVLILSLDVFSLFKMPMIDEKKKSERGKKEEKKDEKRHETIKKDKKRRNNKKSIGGK